MYNKKNHIKLMTKTNKMFPSKIITIVSKIII